MTEQAAAGETEKAITVGVRLHPDALAQLDRMVSRRDSNRSDVLRDLIHRGLQEEMFGLRRAKAS